MNDDKIIKNMMELPERPKRKAEILSNSSLKERIIFDAIRWFWKIKHIFKCEEKHLTEKALMRYCHKCGRMTITDKRLITAFKEGGLKGMMDKKREIIDKAKGRQEIGQSR